MIKRIAAGIVYLGVLVAVPTGQANAMNGKELFDLCSNGSTALRCFSYIDGMQEMLFAYADIAKTGNICMKKINKLELASVVAQYIAEKKAYDWTAPIIYVEALRAKFPCDP